MCYKHHHGKYQEKEKLEEKKKVEQIFRKKIIYRIGWLWISPHIKISKKAMNIMIDFVKHMFRKLANAARLFSQRRKKNFLTEADMLAAIKLVLPPGLLNHAKVHAKLPIPATKHIDYL